MDGVVVRHRLLVVAGMSMIHVVVWPGARVEMVVVVVVVYHVFRLRRRRGPVCCVEWVAHVR